MYMRRACLLAESLQKDCPETPAPPTEAAMSQPHTTQQERHATVFPFFVLIVLLASGCVELDDRGDLTRAERALAPDITAGQALVQYFLLPGDCDPAVDAACLTAAEQCLLAQGLRIDDHYRRMQVLAVTLDETMSAAAAQCPGVRYISPDRPVRAATAPVDPQSAWEAAAAAPLNLSVTTTGAVALHQGHGAVQATGLGVGIAVIDSGVASQHVAIPKSHFLGQVSFLDTRNVKGVKKVDRMGSDSFGHGTMVAGAILSANPAVPGVAPGARVLSLQVLDRHGSGRISDVIAALEWLLVHGDAYGVRVINLSLAAPIRESYRYDPLGQAVEAAVRAGFVVVGTAGNLGMSDGAELFAGIGSPANHPAVLTVGATDSRGTLSRFDDRVAWFSSRGPALVDGVAKPDLLAPGLAVPLPLMPSAKLNQHLVTFNLNPGGRWAYASGTSFSAALVSGGVAQLLEINPNLTPNQVKAILQFTAQPLPQVHALAQGTGMLNLVAAAELASMWIGDPAAAPGDANLTGTLPEQPQSWLNGEWIPWSTTLIWTGYVAYEERFAQLLSLAYVLGYVHGTGIIWDGYVADWRWLDYQVSGLDLVIRYQEAYSLDRVWGTGIIWDGLVVYESSVSFSTQSLALWSGNILDSGKLTAMLTSATTVDPWATPTGLRSDVSEGAIQIPEF